MEEPGGIQFTYNNDCGRVVPLWDSEVISGGLLLFSVSEEAETPLGS